MGLAQGAIRAGRAFVELFGDKTPLVRELRLGERELTRFGAKLTRIGASLNGLGVGLGAPLAASLKTFAGFESNLAAVDSRLNLTSEEMAALTSLAKDLGSTTVFSASQVSEAMDQMSKDGMTVEQILGGVVDLLNLSAGGGIEIGEASNLAGDIASAFGLANDELVRVADTLVRTANRSTGTVEDLGFSFSFAANEAAALDQSLEDTGVAMGLLANKLKKGSLAGTALRRMFVELLKPGKQARLLKDFDVSVIGDDGKFRSILDIMQELGAATAEMTGPQRAALFKDIFGVRAVGAALALAAATDADIENMRALDITAATVAATMNDTLAGSFNGLLASINGLALSIADSLAPHIRSLIDHVRGFVNIASQWAAENDTLVLGIAALVPGLIAVGSALIVAGTAAAALGVILGGIATALSALTSPAILAAIAAIGIGLSTMVPEEGIVASLDRIKSGIMQWVRDIAALIGAGEIGTAMELLTAGMGLAWARVIDTMTGAWRGLQAIVTDGIAWLVGKLAGFLETMQGIIDAMPDIPGIDVKITGIDFLRTYQQELEATSKKLRAPGEALIAAQREFEAVQQRGRDKLFTADLANLNPIQPDVHIPVSDQIEVGPSTTPIPVESAAPLGPLLSDQEFLAASDAIRNAVQNGVDDVARQEFRSSFGTNAIRQLSGFVGFAPLEDKMEMQAQNIHDMKGSMDDLVDLAKKSRLVFGSNAPG